VLFLSPEWDIQYKNRIRPAMEKLLKFLPCLTSKNISPDLIQHVAGHLGEAVKVYFVPDRKNIKDSYKEKYILQALKEVEVFINKDEKSRVTGLEMVKLYFNIENKKYILFHVQYLDGADINIA